LKEDKEKRSNKVDKGKRKKKVDKIRVELITGYFQY
jgi:hypothetical protein